MTPTTAAASSTGFHQWNSPIAYLFAGLALMLGLIVLALVILACSFMKPNSNSNSNSSNGAEEKPIRAVHVVEMEPRIVVIMAGDENPTYLAKPIASTLHGDQQV